MKIAHIGLAYNIAKHVFEVHGIDARGELGVHRRLPRGKYCGSLSSSRLAWSAWRRARAYPPWT